MLCAATLIGRRSYTFVSRSAAVSLLGGASISRINAVPPMTAADGQNRLLWTERIIRDAEDTGIRILHLNKPGMG